MIIEWLGHASFLLQTERGVKIITDPYEPGSYGGAVRYRKIEIEPDIVTISHEHFDHNYLAGFKTKPQVFRQAGEYSRGEIKIKALASFHDEKQGRERGANLIFIFELEGLKVVHLGDLGTTLIDYDALKNTAALLVPVGGVYTLGPQEAKLVCERVNPRLVIPMHFKTEKLGFDIAGVEDFASRFSAVEYSSQSQIEINFQNLPSSLKVVVLRPSH